MGKQAARFPPSSNHLRHGHAQLDSCKFAFLGKLRERNRGIGQGRSQAVCVNQCDVVKKTVGLALRLHELLVETALCSSNRELEQCNQAKAKNASPQPCYIRSHVKMVRRVRR